MKPACLARRGGFTLIEIMIAMAIFMMVVGAIYASWTAILRGSRIGQTTAAEVQRSRVALHVIENSLTAARIYGGNIGYYGFVAENDGDFAFLSYVARLGQAFPRSGRFAGQVVRRLIFSVEPGPNRDNQLVLRQAPLLMEPDANEEETPLVLIPNLSLFNLEFWDEQAEEWAAEWLNTNQIPKVVRVSIGFAPDQNSRGEQERIVTKIVTIPGSTVPPELQIPSPVGNPALNNRNRDPRLNNGNVNPGPNGRGRNPRQPPNHPRFNPGNNPGNNPRSGIPR